MFEQLITCVLTDIGTLVKPMEILNFGVYLFE